MKVFPLLLICCCFVTCSGRRAQVPSNLPVDGGETVTAMVRVPGGLYRPFLKERDQPSTIKIPAFFLDVHAVTNAEFLAFVQANPRWARSRVPRLLADSHYLRQWVGDFDIGNPTTAHSPVTYVSWFAASAYAKWKGKRLPSMAEWEYAASAPPIGIKPGEKLSTIILGWYDRPTPVVLPPVGSIYKNRFGLYDMHGLVWEWVEDFNSVAFQGDDQADTSPAGAFSCAAGALGSTNKEDYAAFMRFAFRDGLQASFCVASLGFRCARDCTVLK